MANPNPSPDTRFKKGDPRCWRKGRPKSFDALRELAQQIAHEAAKTKGEPVVIDGHTATVTEVILRQWAQSKDARLQQAFIKVAYGEDTQRLELSGQVAVGVKGYVGISPDDWDDSTAGDKAE